MLCSNCGSPPTHAGSSVSLFIVVGRGASALSIWLSLSSPATSAWDLFDTFGRAALLRIWLCNTFSLGITYSGFGYRRRSISSGYFGAAFSHSHRPLDLLFTALSSVGFGCCFRIVFVHRCPHSTAGRVCVEQSVQTRCTRSTVAPNSCTRMIHEWMGTQLSHHMTYGDTCARVYEAVVHTGTRLCLAQL